MATSTAIYLGELRVQSVHERSGVQIVTDAPTDNHGKGESFSPTDLACTSLAACMLTILGIWAQEEGLALKGTTAGITKHMLENPRRIGAIDITMFLPKELSMDERQLAIFKRKAEACPVAKSLHPDIKVNLIITRA
jgi:putative redox protein